MHTFACPTGHFRTRSCQPPTRVVPQWLGHGQHLPRSRTRPRTHRPLTNLRLFLCLKRPGQERGWSKSATVLSESQPLSTEYTGIQAPHSEEVPYPSSSPPGLRVSGHQTPFQTLVPCWQCIVVFASIVTYYHLPPVRHLPPVQQSRISRIVTLLSSDSAQIQHRQIA